VWPMHTFVSQNDVTLYICGLRASSWPESVFVMMVMRHSRVAYAYICIAK